MNKAPPTQRWRRVRSRIGRMDENPYQSPTPESEKSAVRHVLPSVGARIFSMIFICVGAGFAVLATLIISEIARLKFGYISIFEEPPVPSWMALISSTLATIFIAIGILLRRASSKRKQRLQERL